ncbi:MAG: hypothetical protein QGG42_06215 [Phycisphaerae bacterium]|jgi:hypothetical protein|nr:hypothetical protein [Phycisphaerae bacterium]
MKRKWAIGLVILLLAGLILLWRLPNWGKQPKTPRGPTSRPAARARVVEITVAATDKLPARAMIIEPPGDLSGEVFPDPERPGELIVTRAAVGAILAGEGDEGLRIIGAVDGLSDVRTVVLLRVEYAGQGRTAEIRRVILSDKPGWTPQLAAPRELIVAPMYPLAPLEVLPGPEGFSWTVADDGKLAVRAGGETFSLAAGEATELPEARIAIPVRVAEMSAIMLDDDADANPAGEMRWRELGDVEFTTRITVRHLGRLSVRISP